jgi:hypothetical protein
MISVKIGDFIEQKYNDDDDFDLYVVKNKEVLYIGISSVNIWDRWFNSIDPHIEFSNNRLIGRSLIGNVIVNHLPESLNWDIELWTLNDCINYLGDNSPYKSLQQIKTYDYAMRKLERALIRAMKPKLNYEHNISAEPTKYEGEQQDLTTAPCDVLGLRLYQ